MFCNLIVGMILSITYGSIYASSLRDISSNYPSGQGWNTLTLDDCGQSSGDTRIVGGEPVTPGAYPWMVSLQGPFKGEVTHLCGAAILNEHWIITAAHCFQKKYDPSRYRCVAGITELSEVDNQEVHIYEVSRIIPHPNYDARKIQNDIALIETLEPIAIDYELIGGICLPEDDQDPTGNATVTGWGSLASGNVTTSDEMMEVEIPLVDVGECDKHYTEELQETNICAGIEHKDSCKGDSGGPLFQTDEGVSTLIGIVSFGWVCGSTKPGVYTKVSSYLSWMEDVILQ